MHAIGAQRRPNFPVGSLAYVVSSCQAWFESVHFCWRYGGKTLPDEASSDYNSVAYASLIIIIIIITMLYYNVDKRNN